MFTSSSARTMSTTVVQTRMFAHERRTEPIVRARWARRALASGFARSSAAPDLRPAEGAQALALEHRGAVGDVVGDATDEPTDESQRHRADDDDEDDAQRGSDEPVEPVGRAVPVEVFGRRGARDHPRRLSVIWAVHPARRGLWADLGRSLWQDSSVSDPHPEQAPVPEPLLQLAAAYGVVPEHRDLDGGQRAVSATTLVSVLEALGVPASSPEKVAVSLLHSEDNEWRRVLPPTLVVRQGDSVPFPVHVSDGAAVEVWIELEAVTGAHTGQAPRERRDLSSPTTTPSPAPWTAGGRAGDVRGADDLPLGWHDDPCAQARARRRAARWWSPRTGSSCPRPCSSGRAWGLMAQLYSVRSRASWGVGDLADLAELGWLGAARELGADFVLVNPLHAAEPTRRR